MRAFTGGTLSTLVALALGVAPRVGAPQPATLETRERPRTWSVDIGAVVATPLVEDGNGVTVRTAPGPSIGGQVALRSGEPVGFTVGVQASTAAIRIESAGSNWRGGRSQRYDLRVGIETRALGFVSLGASGLAGVITGPDDVIPFRRNAGRLAVWGGDVAVSFPVLRDPDMEVLVAASVARLASQQRENPPLAGGWLGQLRLGVRHAVR